MMSRVRSLVVATCMLAMICAPPVMGGCAEIGSDAKQDFAAINTRNGSPVSLGMVDAEGTWGVNGLGPARYSSVTDKGIETLQSGTTPRDIVFTRGKDGVLRFGFQTGDDFRFGLFKYDPVTGAMEVRDFDASASAPLKALERITELVMLYNAARDQASRDAIIEQIKMLGQVIPEVAAKVIEGLLGKPPLP